MANKKSAFEHAANLALNAKALHDIIKAALSKGFSGAAIEALKHYWVKLIPIAIVALLLPIIIYLSIPMLIVDALTLPDLTPEQLIEMYYNGYADSMSEYQQMIENDFYETLGYYEFYTEDSSAMISGKVETSDKVMDRDWFVAIHMVYIRNQIPTIHKQGIE